MESGKELLKGWAIGDIEPVKGKIRVAFELGKSPLFEADVVRVVQVVHADHSVALAEQTLADLPADKASAACHQGREGVGCWVLGFRCQGIHAFERALRDRMRPFSIFPTRS